jgi:hypothetical protein
MINQLFSDESPVLETGFPALQLAFKYRSKVRQSVHILGFDLADLISFDDEAGVA